MQTEFINSLLKVTGCLVKLLVKLNTFENLKQYLDDILRVNSNKHSVFSDSILGLNKGRRNSRNMQNQKIEIREITEMENKLKNIKRRIHNRKNHETTACGVNKDPR